MMNAAEVLAPEVGTRCACEAFGVARATLYRHRGGKNKVDAVESTEKTTSPRALQPEERQAVLEVLHSERFVDKAPHEIYATLLDEGIYHCSIRTMYRILEEQEEVRERRDQLRHPAYEKPELLATGPNQVWSWDITKLMGPAKWNYFHLYVIIDIYSRYVVGWMVATHESAQLAKRFIEETCTKQQIVPGQLTIHADRGSSMKSKPVAFLLSDLGITKTHSRPHTSDDNPFSEAQFKTLKYRPDFPDRFGAIEDARSFCRDFFSWYNKEHNHTGISLLTPQSVHYGSAEKVLQARASVLSAAYQAHPERFVNGAPSVKQLPKAVWINPPKNDSHTAEDKVTSEKAEIEATNQAAAQCSPPITERSGCRPELE